MVVHGLQAQNQSMRPAAPLSSYIAVSLSNVIATSCQYEALKYVTFPVQTLGKCAKMIPVMAWGTLISHKAYSAKDVCVAALVTAGCTCFLLSGQATSKGANQSSCPGLACMLVYLAFDGFTATFQLCSPQTPPPTRIFPPPLYPLRGTCDSCLKLVLNLIGYYSELLQHVSIHLQYCFGLRATAMLTMYSMAVMAHLCRQGFSIPCLQLSNICKRARMQKEQIE